MMKWCSLWPGAQSFHITGPSFTLSFISIKYDKGMRLWCRAKPERLSVKRELNHWNRCQMDGRNASEVKRYFSLKHKYCRLEEGRRRKARQQKSEESKHETHKHIMSTSSSEQASWQFQVNHSFPEANIHKLESPYKNRFHVVVPS